MHDVAHDAAHAACSLRGMPCSISCPICHVCFSCQPLLSMSVRSLAAQEGWRLAAEMYFGWFFCDSQLEMRKCNSRAALHFEVAISEMEMRERAFRNKLRFSSARRAQLLLIETSEPRKCNLRSTCALATARVRKQARKQRDNFPRPFRKQRTHQKTYGNTARALRRAQSLLRVRCDQDTFAQRHRESALTRAISAKLLAALQHARSPQSVRRARDAFARRHSETRDLRRGFASGSRRIRAASQGERFNARSLCRGFAELDTFARRRSESSSTPTIFAEDSPRSRHARGATRGATASTRTISTEGHFRLATLASE